VSLQYILKEQTLKIQNSVLKILSWHSFWLLILSLSLNQNPMDSFFTRSLTARHWWLMPVILATQKTEIRRIMV
jgi:hypothetical protein